MVVITTLNCVPAHWEGFVQEKHFSIDFEPYKVIVPLTDDPRFERSINYMAPQFVLDALGKERRKIRLFDKNDSRYLRDGVGSMGLIPECLYREDEGVYVLDSHISNLNKLGDFMDTLSRFQLRNPNKFRYDLWWDLNGPVLSKMGLIENNKWHFLPTENATETVIKLINKTKKS